MSDRERSTRVRASLVRITRTGTSTRTAVSVNAALQIVTNNRMYTKMYGPDSRHDGRRVSRLPAVRPSGTRYLMNSVHADSF